MGGDGVEGGMVALVALIFPDVDYDMSARQYAFRRRIVW